MQPLVILNKTPEGLEIRLRSSGRVEAIEMREEGKPSSMIMENLLEFDLANGWTLLSAADIGALTSCDLILSDEVQYTDDGRLQSAGNIYWHMRYQIEDPVEQLLANKLILEKA